MTTVETAPPVEEKHWLAEMNGKGDTKLMWDPDDEAEVAAAAGLFATLKAQGRLAYSVGPNGEPDEVIHEFSKDCQAIIMSKPLQGG